MPQNGSKILIGRQKYPAFNKVKFTMSGIQAKIARNAKEENTTHNEEKNQWTG